MGVNHSFTFQSFMGFSSNEELENAIETCRETILRLPKDSEDRKMLIKKLIQLRLKLLEEKVFQSFYFVRL